MYQSQHAPGKKVKYVRTSFDMYCTNPKLILRCFIIIFIFITLLFIPASHDREIVTPENVEKEINEAQIETQANIIRKTGYPQRNLN